MLGKQRLSGPFFSFSLSLSIWKKHLAILVLIGEKCLGFDLDEM